MKYKYHFDGYLNGRACGWILDMSLPAQRVPLGLYFEGRLIHSCVADMFRVDIRDAGIGDGCCAFEIPVDVSKELEVEIRVLTNGMLLDGSRKSFLTRDDYVNVILRSRHFDEYAQFKPQNLVNAAKAVGTVHNSKRLTVGFSQKVVTREGVVYSAHMEWLCARLRRGSPAFSSPSRRNTLDDLYWYLFECLDASKALAEYDLDYLGQPVFSLFPNMQHHTVLFDLWLHRQGRKLVNLRSEGIEAHFDFYHSLTSANSCLPEGAGMDTEYRLSGLFGAHNFGGDLPSITNHLKGKWERGYQQLYQLEDSNGYILFLFDSCLHAKNAREIKLFGRSVLDFFRAPIELVGGVSSRFSLLCYALTARAYGGHGANFSQFAATEVNTWFDGVWLKAHPLHSAFALDALPSGDKTKADPICYVVAHWKSASGLTQNAQMSVNVLSEAGISVVKLLPNGEIHGKVSGSNEANSWNLTRECVILHVNADEAPSALYSVAALVNLDAAFVVGYYLWELEVIPDAHKLGIQLVDEIWVPTEFVACAYRAVAPEKVVKVGKAISVPKFTTADRRKFDLEPSAIVYLTSFDFHSSIERKNPLAAVKAFLKAFPSRSDVQLVLKSTRPQAGHWGDPYDQWGQIAELAACDKRLRVIDEFLPETEMFELIACSDVIVSPHRAEGFGYIPAYGLLYGKQVVVTGYGGTSDFCDESNAWIVPFQLVKLPHERFIYPLYGGKWADIDEDALAACMLKACSKYSLKGDMKKSPIATPKVKFTKEQFTYSGLRKRYAKRLLAARVIEA